MWRAAVRLAGVGWGFAEDDGRGYSSEDFENGTFEPQLVSFGSPVRRLHRIDKCMTAVVASLVRFIDLTTLQFSRLAGTTDATLHAVAAGCPMLSRFTLDIHAPTLITPSGLERFFNLCAPLSLLGLAAPNCPPVDFPDYFSTAIAHAIGQHPLEHVSLRNLKDNSLLANFFHVFDPEGAIGELRTISLDPCSRGQMRLLFTRISQAVPMLPGHGAALEKLDIMNLPIDNDDLMRLCPVSWRPKLGLSDWLMHLAR
jgi:hypothetical protein